MKVLITGVSGLLGNNLARYLKDKYEVLGLYNSHPVVIKGVTTARCDLTDESGVDKAAREFDPNVVIHCASLTNVDECESYRQVTKEVNVVSTGRIVRAVKSRDIKLIYISTDAVYDGVQGNFSEDSGTNPLNYYGQTKYEGELEVMKSGNPLVLRTNIFGWNILNKKSLGEWILSELFAGRKIRCFKDAYFSSIYTFEFARVIDIAIGKDLKGVYNCGSSDPCSKCEFAVKIADAFGFDRGLILPISIDDFHFEAKRGKKLSLNVEKIRKALDYNLPTIDASVGLFYKDFKCGLPEDIKKFYNTVVGKNQALPYGRQSLDENDFHAVDRVLRSERITQGPKVEEFEKELVEYCGAKYAVVVSNGTAALHIACMAAGIGPGDEAITTPITFVASANCAVYCNATPVFADIEEKTYNIFPVEIGKKINVKTKAVIPVHFAGQSCDMEAIRSIVCDAERKHGHKIYIIEDGCHALGSLYKGKKVGSCACSDMTVMSFHPVKHITTGEGGAILTNDEKLYKKLKRLRSHGITAAPEEFVNAQRAFVDAERGGAVFANPWYYEQIDLGYNYRLTDFQCALGVSQIRRLDDFRARRKEIVRRYNDAFTLMENIKTPFESHDCDSNFHLYVLRIDFKKAGVSRAKLMSALKEKGICTQVHYIPVHLQPYYMKIFGTMVGQCPAAEKYYEECLSIPLFSSMSGEDAERVIVEIKNHVKGERWIYQKA